MGNFNPDGAGRPPRKRKDLFLENKSKRMSMLAMVKCWKRETAGARWTGGAEGASERPAFEANEQGKGQGRASEEMQEQPGVGFGDEDTSSALLPVI